MIVVRYADIGVGFRPQETATPVPRKFWDTARDLVHGELGQPAVRSTGAHPVWGLRLLAIAHEDWWCFSAQGRGGRFGAAGTCRFGFLPATWPPARVWRTGVDTVAADDVVAPTTLSTQEGEDLAAGVLAGIRAGRPSVRLATTPADAAALIPSLLATLPPVVSARYVWSTCLLSRHDFEEYGVVAAPWPTEFRAEAGRLADQIDGQLLAPPLAASRPQPSCSAAAADA
jgi:hypothetical protein